ncbi:MAG: hypothetical protein F6K18_10955 [Okeania sp. SIO2C2]|uniref:hypothetical protein n=1 Tax=Okeania sp. SIO2C2 TaxID=2607787 RepID=UPI0013BDC0F6|nr:hypothetical protein [Okeania sp. SIO2C2]NEP87302.1 hypothetical protein [Okeania sp. SIO2C2]
MYNKGKEEGRGKKEEGRGRKATLARKKPLFPVDIHPWVYTNDINGHDITYISNQIYMMQKTKLLFDYFIFLKTSRKCSCFDFTITSPG